MKKFDSLNFSRNIETTYLETTVQMRHYVINCHLI